MMGYILVALVALVLGHGWGWVNAHKAVARECQRLGGFYLGETVYRCVEISKAIEKNK